jgi:hypothetical protein
MMVVEPVSLFARIRLRSPVASCSILRMKNARYLLSPTRRNFRTSFVSFTQPNFPQVSLALVRDRAQRHLHYTVHLLFRYESTAQQHLPTRCYKYFWHRMTRARQEPTLLHPQAFELFQNSQHDHYRDRLSHIHFGLRHAAFASWPPSSCLKIIS